MSTAFLVDNILNEEKEEHIDSTGSISDSDESDSEHNSDLKDSLCDSPKSYNSINNNQNSSLSDDDLMRSYTMIQDQPDHTDHLSEFTCAKCGHFNENQNNNKLDDGPIDSKCEKCSFNNEFLNNSKDTTILKDSTSKPVLKFSVSAILSDTKRDCVKVRNGKFPALIFSIGIRFIICLALRSYKLSKSLNFFEFDLEEIRRSICTPDQNFLFRVYYTLYCQSSYI